MAGGEHCNKINNDNYVYIKECTLSFASTDE